MKLSCCSVIVSPCDLTFADIHTSFGHEAHPSLGLLTAEGVEVVDVRRLLCDLKITDTAVSLHKHTEHKNTRVMRPLRRNRSAPASLYLSTEVDHVCIGIVIW